jgi:hypothetical protein
VGDERRWTLFGTCLGGGGFDFNGVLRGPRIGRDERVKVMPVSEHEATLAAARQVTDEMVLRALDAHEARKRRLADAKARLNAQR